MRSFRVALLSSRGFLRYNNSTAQPCKGNYVCVSLFILGFGIAKAGELILNRLRISEDLKSWNKYISLSLSPLNQSRRTHRLNLLTHQSRSAKTSVRN